MSELQGEQLTPSEALFRHFQQEVTGNASVSSWLKIPIAQYAHVRNLQLYKTRYPRSKTSAAAVESEQMPLTTVLRPLRGCQMK